MRITSTFVIVAILIAGCSKPVPEPPSVKPVVQWFTNEHGLIASAVTPKKFGKFSQLRDPLEDAPEFASAFRDAKAHAKAATQQSEGKPGRVHSFWKLEKEFLREKYRIDWKSPAELNPNFNYD